MMSSEQLVDITNKLLKIDRELAQGFMYSEDKFNFLKDNEEVLRNNRKFTDVYNTYKDIVGDRMKRLDSLMKDKELYTKDITPAEMKSFLDKNPDIGESDVNEYISKQREYKSYYEAEREKEAGKKRREIEVQNWGKEGPWYRDIMASDYEKQRYIDDPNKAIFGKETPLFGDAPEIRYGAIGDLAAGTAATVADLGTAAITPASLGLGLALNSTVGPAIRFSRDIAHKVTDSPYQKDWGTIAKDTGKDIGLNAGAYGLANARKVVRLVSGATSPETKLYLDLAEETNNIKKGLQQTEDILTNGNLTRQEKLSQLKAMPNSEYKSSIEGILNNASKHPNAEGEILDMWDKYARSVNPTFQSWGVREINFPNKGYSKVFKRPETNYFNKVMTTPKPNNIEMKLVNAADKINTGKPGAMLYETAPTLADVRGSKPSREQTRIDKLLMNEQKNDYKQSESRFWRAGFAPKKIEGDPLWESYKEWYKEEYGRDVEDK